MTSMTTSTTRARMRTCVIFGLGYVGYALALALTRAGGWVVSGTTREGEGARVARFRERGIDVVQFDPYGDDDDDEGERDIGRDLVTKANANDAEGERARMDAHERLSKLVREAEAVIVTVPPNGDFNRDPVLEFFAKELCDVKALGAKKRFVGYCGSTSVYGDRGGGWVNERAPCAPNTPKSKARFDAEMAWRALETSANGDVKVVSYRLGGIYGPGRSAIETAKKRRETKAAGNSESASQRSRERRSFTSRVHVGDIVSVIVASMKLGERASEVYNVVDDEPAPRRDAVRYAEKILGFAEDDVDAEENKDSAAEQIEVEGNRGEKRVENARIKNELGVSLRFPTYREGLDAIARGDRYPFE